MLFLCFSYFIAYIKFFTVRSIYGISAVCVLFLIGLIFARSMSVLTVCAAVLCFFLGNMLSMSAPIASVSRFCVFIMVYYSKYY